MSEEVENSAAPLIEHLTELRDRLIKSVAAFLIGMIICFTVWNPIYNFLTEPLIILKLSSLIIVTTPRLYIFREIFMLYYKKRN